MRVVTFLAVSDPQIIDADCEGLPAFTAAAGAAGVDVMPAMDWPGDILMPGDMVMPGDMEVADDIDVVAAAWWVVA